MRRLRLVSIGLAIFALAAVVALTWDRPALAVGSQIRTFVATTGSDSNPCTRTAPCRLFAAALAQTAAGGEVVALDTGGFGSLTITQGVTITAAPGVQAFIAPSSGAAITVNAGGATVTLRNLQLNGVGADTGVDYQAGGRLNVENLTISGFIGPEFVGWGIRAWLIGAQDLYVSDTTIRGTYIGIDAEGADVTIVRSLVEDSAFGIDLSEGTRAVIQDTTIAGNAIGVSVTSDVSPADVTLEGCVVTGNGNALWTDGAADGVVLRVSNSTITGNGTAITVLGGQILSRGNNTVEGNTSNGAFSGTYAAK